MKKFFSKAVTLLMALTMSAFFVSCKGPGNPVEDEDPNKENITVWVQYTQQGFFEQVEEGFEELNPNINVRIIGQPESNLGGSLDATLGTDSRPDIFATYGGLIAATLFKSGHLLNLNDIIAPIEDKLVGAAKSNKKDGNGQYYTAPLNGFASPVIYYNKTMFEQMKSSNVLNAEQKAAVKEPETYAEFVALCNAVEAYGKQTVVAGFSTWHLPHFMQAMHTRTMTVEDYAKLLDKNADPNPFDTDSFQEGFKLLKKYYDDGILTEGLTGYTVDTANSLFYNDEAAMRMGVSLDYTALNENVTFDIGAFFLPSESSNPGAPRATGVYGDVIAVSAQTEHAEACKKFIQYVMSAETQAWLADYSLFPARSDADITGRLSATLEGLYNEMSKGMNDFYQSWSYQGVDIELLEAGTDVLSGKTSIEESSLAARNKIAAFFALGKQQSSN